MRAEQAYVELMRRVRDEATLASIEALLEWDEETSMPAGAVEGRSEQLALLGLERNAGEVDHDRTEGHVGTPPAQRPARTASRCASGQASKGTAARRKL